MNQQLADLITGCVAALDTGPLSDWLEWNGDEQLADLVRKYGKNFWMLPQGPPPVLWRDIGNPTIRGAGRDWRTRPCFVIGCSHGREMIAMWAPEEIAESYPYNMVELKHHVLYTLLSGGKSVDSRIGPFQPVDFWIGMCRECRTGYWGVNDANWGNWFKRLLDAWDRLWGIVRLGEANPSSNSLLSRKSMVAL